LKPAWDKLGDEYDGSSTVLIGDVDCTVHQNLCQKYGVQGYPTLKYFTANPMGDSYNGGRDYEELSKFAKESLGPSCGVEHMDLCDAEQKKSLEAKMALSDAELEKLIEESDAKLKQADEDLEALLKGLQQQYEDGKKAKDDAQAAISPELAQLRSVKRSRDKGAKQEL
jgi:protein disulfide-isomerase A6